MTDPLHDEIAAVKNEMIAWRRYFHQHPELGMKEKRTAQKITTLLRGFGLEVVSGVGQTGVIGMLKGSGSGKTVLLRADMDALPLKEETGLAYKSNQPGVMHACGHDGHMAMLLGVAKVLSTGNRPFAGNIKLVFQPGEEGFGGAGLMIRDGVLKDPDVDAAFALHLVSTLPTGTIGLKPGPIMASMDSFEIKINGKGGHAAMPEGGVDAILTGAQVITALQSLISKEISPLTPLVVHVGTIKGGEAFNIVAAQVELKGTVRTLDAALRQSMPERMERIIKGIVQSYRGSYEMLYNCGYPIVSNDTAMTDLVKKVAEKFVEPKKILEVPYSMGSDDMAMFLEKVPGCYFFLGAGNADKGTDQPHHNHRFDIDEEALTVGAEMLTRTALTYLQVA